FVNYTSYFIVCSVHKKRDSQLKNLYGMEKIPTLTLNSRYLVRFNFYFGSGTFAKERTLQVALRFAKKPNPEGLNAPGKIRRRQEYPTFQARMWIELVEDRTIKLHTHQRWPGF
ncbi:MAG: hypothetical protein KAT15_28090, partial [Bacteroidales bacterium]|nr:hypothetical protein [Bacteroidales bacterium]